MKSPSNNTPRLVIIEGKDKGKIIHLKDGTVVLGRSKGDVLIHDPRISRSHVALHYDRKTEKLTYTDLKSLNGTTINGDEGAAGSLNDGDKIKIGDTLIDCQIGIGEETLASYRVGPKKMETSASLLEMDDHLKSGPVADNDTNRTFIGKNPQSLFLRVPKALRISSLVLLLIGLYIFFGNAPSLSPEELEREISSIQRLELGGKYDEAFQKAEKLTKQLPENSRGFLLLGDLLASRNKREQAIAAYRKAHGLKPSQPIVHIRLIRLYLKAGLIREGMEELKHAEDVIKDGPEDEQTKEVFIETANLFLEFKDELKQPPEKTLIIAKALQNTIAPNRSIGFRLEAEIYLEQKKYPEAIEILEKARRVEPRDEGVFSSLAKVHLYARDTASAQKVVEGWIQLAPTATRPLIVAAFLKSVEKDYTAALALLQKVIQLAKNPQEPDYAQALHNMGIIHFEQNQVNEAESALREACGLGVSESCEHPLLKDAAAVKSPASKE
jgi:cytochrome c-type biogenesis protein CcmH/NrfG